MQTFKIPEACIHQVQAEIKRINSRSKKIGGEPIELKIIDTVKNSVQDDDLGFFYNDTWLIVAISGSYPKIHNWEFVAAIEQMPNNEILVREFPGETCPDRYRTTNIACEHCNLTRKRNFAYVLRHIDGSYKKVGKNCLTDFLNNQTIENLIAKLAIYINGFDLLQRTSVLSGKVKNMVPIEKFVFVTASVIRNIGWLPRTKAGMNEKSTCDIAWELCVNPHSKQSDKLIKEFNLKISDDDVELAKNAIEWASKIHPENAESSYYHDIGVCCRQNHVEFSKRGFVASIIQTYKKSFEKMSPNLMSKGEWIGEIGERITIRNVKVTKISSYKNGIYQKTLIKFLDPEGNNIFWRASGIPDWPELEMIVTIKGTVRHHSNFCEVKETEIQRVERIEIDKVSLVS